MVLRHGPVGGAAVSGQNPEPECWCGIPHEYLDIDSETGEMFDIRDIEEEQR
jgi:hypothetical protein